MGQVGSGLTVVFEVLQAVAYQVDLDRSSVDFGCHGLAGLEGLLIFGSVSRCCSAIVRTSMSDWFVQSRVRVIRTGRRRRER